MNKSKQFSSEVRERAVRLVQEHRGEYPSLWAAVESIAPKIGCVPSTLLAWVKRAEIDAGQRSGMSTAEAPLYQFIFAADKVSTAVGMIVAELRKTLLGWKAYFGIAEVLSPLRDIDKWLRRKLRCTIWKQWGRAGYRELRKRGVSVREAWNTSKNAGPWRLSKTPALSLALPARFFRSLDLPSLDG